VADELLPRAFSSRRGTSVWLDAVHGWLAVDAASAARAEEALGLLRDCLDDLPAAPLRTQTSPLAAMTSWLAAGEAPAGFSIDRDAVLQSPNEEKSTVRYARHPLEGEEIRRHIANGKVVTRLSLTWNDRVSFQLTDTLHVKQLAFLDLVKEEAESQAETADEQFDADFAIMTGELAPFLADLTQALGGEETNP
jgi:recombination associated protein RdgC